jgi:hypothetical protein
MALQPTTLLWLHDGPDGGETRASAQEVTGLVP